MIPLIGSERSNFLLFKDARMNNCTKPYMPCACTYFVSPGFFFLMHTSTSTCSGRFPLKKKITLRNFNLLFCLCKNFADFDFTKQVEQFFKGIKIQCNQQSQRHEPDYGEVHPIGIHAVAEY